MRRCLIRWPFVLLFLIGCALVESCWAVEGPILPHDDTATQREFKNVYDAIKSVPSGVFKSSSMTLQGITVDSITVNSFASIPGLVLQVVAGSSASDSAITADGAYHGTNLTATITLRNAKSRVIVLATGATFTASGGGLLAIFRDTTDLSNGSGHALSTTNEYTVTMQYTEIPGGTGPYVYNVKAKGSAGTIHFGDTTIQRILLVEISG